jgi:hypothetical protein
MVDRGRAVTSAAARDHSNREISGTILDFIIGEDTNGFH